MPKKNASGENIKQMARELSLPVWFVKHALDVDLSPFEQERMERSSAEEGPDEVLACVGVFLAETFDDARDAFDWAPEDSTIEDRALRKMVDLAQSLEEIGEAYDLAPEGSEVERYILSQWKENTRVAVEGVETFDETMEYYTHSPEFENEDPVLEKAIELAETPKDFCRILLLTRKRGRQKIVIQSFSKLYKKQRRD